MLIADITATEHTILALGAPRQDDAAIVATIGRVKSMLQPTQKPDDRFVLALNESRRKTEGKRREDE